MSVERTATTFRCDWTDEYGEVCGTEQVFGDGAPADTVARNVGWASYTNAYVRRARWEKGVALWFCPVHATVFRNNHGWGSLEKDQPPRHPWRSFFWRKEPVDDVVIVEKGAQR